MKKTLLLMLFTGTQLLAQAQAGLLDTSFDTDGVTSALIGPTTDRAHAVAVQPDGKIVATGKHYNGTNFDFATMRFNTNGSLDLTFGGTGKVTTDFANSVEVPSSILIQPDGKIVVAGYMINSASTDNFALARYNADGTLDATFGTGGKVITNFDMVPSFISDLALQPDGKIIASGNSYDTGGYTNMALARYNINGSPDSTFDGDGKRLITDPVTGYASNSNSVCVQADGKILSGGWLSTMGGYNVFFLARLNSNGSLDNTFDGDGMANALAPSAFSSEIRDMALQADGKIVVTGHGIYSGLFKIVTARFNTTGSPDLTFDTDGFNTVPVDPYYNYATGVVMQADSKILICGHSNDPSGGPDEFVVARYLANGSYDPAFGTGGVAYPNTGFTGNECNDIALQPDGKIVIAGGSVTGTSDEFVLVRLLSDVGGININETGANSVLNIYPNPVSNVLTISGEQIFTNTSLKLIDVTGQVVLQNENITGNKFAIDVSALVPGIYFLELTNGEQRLCKKLIKQ